MSKSKMTIDKHGDKVWRLPNGKKHREDGPAVETNYGYKAWYANGLRHREDGPAMEWSNGDKEWWLEGINYTEQEYYAKNNELLTECGSTIEYVNSDKLTYVNGGYWFENNTSE